MLGECSFKTMSEEGIKGQVFLSLYLFACMVLMLNFLIAVIFSTYSRLEEQKAGLHLRTIIEEQPRWAFDPEFNLFTYRVPLVNLLLLVLFPCAWKFSAKNKQLIERVEYFPAFIMSIVFVFFTDLVFFPFAWITLLRRSYHRGRFKSFIFYFLFFPFIGAAMCVADTVVSSYLLWSPASCKQLE